MNTNTAELAGAMYAQATPAFEGIERLLTSARGVLMIALFVVGLALAVIAVIGKRTMVSAISAGAAMIAAVALFMTAPALTDSAVAQIEKDTGAGSGDAPMGSMFGDANR